VGQPQSPESYPILLANDGSQTTTYDLSFTGVPAGVTAAFSQPTVTLAPGQTSNGMSGAPALFAIITSNSTTQLVPFSFNVVATALGAPEITRSTTGAFEPRTATVQVVGVDPNPAFTNPGGQVDVTARIVNAVNTQQKAAVSYTVSNPAGTVIFTSQPVTTTLNVLTTVDSVDLGNLDTTGFALGQDTITVTVDDRSGRPIAGATGTGNLLIGTPVTANLSVSPTTLPIGTGTVANTLQVSGSTTIGTPTTITLMSNASTLAASTPDEAVLDTGDTTGLTFVPALEGSFGSFTPVPTGAPAGTEVVNIPPGDGESGFFEVTFTLPAGFTNASLSGAANIDDYGRAFLNGAPISPSIFSSDPNLLSEFANSSFSTNDNSLFVVGQNVLLFSDDNHQFGGPSAAAFYANVTYTAGGTAFPTPLTLLGQTQTTAVGESVALNGSMAYVAGTGGIDVVDVSNPASPQVLTRFAQSDVVAGGLAYLQISGNDLIAAYQGLENAGGSRFLIYSLADPADPALVSSTFLSDDYVSGMFVQGHTVFFSTDGNYYQPGLIGQFGDFSAVDITDPANPRVTGVLFSGGSAPNLGVSNQYATVPVSATAAYVAGTTSTGGIPSGQTTTPGEGELSIVDTSNPASLTLASGTGQLLIPNSNRLLGLAIDGNRALVVGNTDGHSSSGPLQGNITLTVLDITDPLNPVILGRTLVTSNVPSNAVGGRDDLFGGMALDLGNGLFAVSHTDLNGKPVVELVNINDPSNLVTAAFSVPADVFRMAASGGKLYVTSAGGLSIYQVGQVLGIPVSASVEVPNNTGVTYDSSSFNIAPSQIIPGAGFDTLVWNTTLGAGLPTATFTWNSTVSNLQPGELRDVTLGASVGFTSQGTPGTLTLPRTAVTGDQIIGLMPVSRTVAPGAPALYSVELLNPTNSAVTYSLSVQGVASSWVNLASSVNVAANGSMNVPLTITSDPFAATGDVGFTVSAAGNNGASASVGGDLILQGAPAAPDPQARGIVATLTPTQAAVGQGTAARFVVQLTNTGSVDDTLTLSVTGLPGGVTAALGQTTIDVPPGSSNFRDVVLTLTAQPGTTAGAYGFTVDAVSTTRATVTGAAAGTLNVVTKGVRVTLGPSTGSPGDTFTMTVLNTGSVTDTYDLALGGPIALIATLGATTTKPLAPGAFQTITITTKPAGFALPGTLDLTAIATSEANSSVKGSATSALSVSPSQGLAAKLSPSVKLLPVPGTTSFLLEVNNTGNQEDAYTATITGTSGPVAASLVGQGGAPTQTIAVFRLPALSAAAILLDASLLSPGEGTVSIGVQSLMHPSLTASATAQVSTQVTPPPPPTGDGPRVTSVVRYGIHRQPTTIVLTFDQPLDPTRAQDVSNDIIIAPNGKRVAIASAVYDSATRTVTLHPSRRLNFHHHFKLTVNGNALYGLTDTQGLALDGDNNGKPGSNYVTTLTRHNLIIGARTPRVSHAFAHASKTKPRATAQHDHARAQHSASPAHSR